MDSNYDGIEETIKNLMKICTSTNNIVKYANCSEVKIHLYRNKNKVVMEIADNGVGFDMNTNYSGNGLHSMQDRSRKLKGKFKIISEIGKGTKINLIFEI